MRLRGLLHHHPTHRARQLYWVVPTVALLLGAGIAAFVIQYHFTNQAVSTEFFRAHKTISHTGQLMERGTLIAAAVLALLVVAIAAWTLRLTHRIVRPVHTMHVALDALTAGDLGVRVELHQGDEFHEVGDALNRLVDEFATTLGTVHALVDRVAVLTEQPGNETSATQVHALIVELDQTMEFFQLAPRRTIREGDE